MQRIDPAVLAHLEWLGFVQPTGLVVSPTALVQAGAILERSDVAGQRLLIECVQTKSIDPGCDPVPMLPDFTSFAQKFLGWSFSPRYYAGIPGNPVPPELEKHLEGYSEILRPEFAVREPDPQSGRSQWQLLISIARPETDFDDPVTGASKYEGSHHSRMERLLRSTGVAAGLLFNSRSLRLISAPHGESSGWIDFKVQDMIQSAGRPISTALRMLLNQMRLIVLPRTQRLAALLEDSRRYQNTVSERLAEQVLHALYEFLRGLQAAQDVSGGHLLRETLRECPNRIYHAILTVILRLVFLLYAEERNLLPADDAFIQYYSLSGLYDRLRDDAALYPDTMDQRYGAWAQLLALFRILYDGAECGKMMVPKRHGILFDPDRFPFLEGRTGGGSRQNTERIDPPLIPDGTIYRALEKLLVLDGERISYRALDVEQIGSVYETMMGFRLETTTGPSIALRSQKKHGAPVAVNLNALLNHPVAQRDKWLQEAAGRKFSDGVKKAVREADSLEDLHAAMQSVIDSGATPDIIPPGAMVLQPSDERRRSGSHYTPRTLTQPIVEKALEPIWERLKNLEGKPPSPDQILDLKICDPAMGSGAFLVEACRQIGNQLVDSWNAHGGRPAIPPDEDEVIFARRLVAQRCLYGVDRNPLAVDLAKVSLWLITLAKDHPLAFVDHALRHGDSLVGLSSKQFHAMHWDQTRADFIGNRIRESIETIVRLRKRIRMSGDSIPDWELRDLLGVADSELRRVRLYGDLTVAAFFEGKNPKERESNRAGYAADAGNDAAERHRGRIEELRGAERPLLPFHWELEFPEVFYRENPGFDAIVGNPPFAGKNTLSEGNFEGYPDWLKEIHPESHGNSDLVAHFFRRAFDLIRQKGTFGLIATNTIAQGDTRSTGLRWICHNGGTIYNALKRVKWPGLAAVVVSVLHGTKGSFAGIRRIDERNVEKITAFLFHAGGNDDPERLESNSGKSYVGSYVLGMGFTFDDTDTKGVATPIVEMHRLIEQNPANAEVIFPYIGGEEVNTSPTHAHHRYVINFGERSEEECRRRWPELMAIVEAKVKPERMLLADNPDGRRRKQFWWQFGRYTPSLFAAIAGLDRVLTISRVGQQLAFAFLPDRMVYAESQIVFPVSCYTFYTIVQSRTHEIWARFFGSTLEDRLRYTPSDCFETFPFPENWEHDARLETAGREYYEYRAALMVRSNEGLTKTYNRFHDPNEISPEIMKLRELHAAMDCVVLNAYGWPDIPTECDFILDYDIDEDEYEHRKKPYRYRWPDTVRDDVLARLLELNAIRAKAEIKLGIPRESSTRKQRRKKPVPDPTTPELF